MKLATIKNAIVYKAHLPDADLLAGHLKEFPFSEIGDLHMASVGFIPNLITAELVTPFQGGLSLSLRIDEKIIPGAAVRKEVQDRVATIEREVGKKLKRAEKMNIKDMVLADFCKQAFVKTTVLNAFYNTEHHLLIVATGSKHYAGVLVSYLVKAVGSVKTETIHISDIKHGLTTKLKTYLNGDDRAFDGFHVGDFTQLSRKVEQKETIKYAADLDSIREELRENLENSYIVDSINLRYGDVSFLLTENFHFKRVDLRELADNDEDDLPYRWRHEASVATLLLTSVINTLCVLLSYKPQEKEINPQ
ncbi:recombination-associated protein RdgC [Rahnella variigena]|uniref:recombination-associated protein RdgC n=1 Tax=Rahnella variigena TaxID=574964 RepID=UPI001330C788|nr:recombination-associated protein RdgC [Rahnella variigena]